MKKQLAAIFLLAGAAVGSGMISLPILLAKFGIIQSIGIMLIFAGLTYLSAIIRSDLNLNSNASYSLKEAGAFWGCERAGKLGNTLLKILSLALMAAYIFGASSIINSFLENTFKITTIIIIFSVFICILFLLTSRTIVFTIKYLFIVMFLIFIALVLSLCFQISIQTIPEAGGKITLKEWATMIPVVFTSFGFQGSLHSMTKFVENDRKLVRRACLWGSLIPAFVYIIWIVAILFIVSNTNGKFYEAMVHGEMCNVGALIEVLSKSTSFKSTQITIWIISIFAILKSILGVGLSLIDIFQNEMKDMKKWKIVLFVVIIPTIIALFVPDAFIRVLNISGIILAIPAIIIPVIISKRMQRQLTEKNKMLLRNNYLIMLVFLSGVSIIAFGLVNFMSPLK